MGEAIKNLTVPFKDKLEGFMNMSPNQKVLALTVCAFIISGLIAMFFWVNKVNHSVLYRNLSMNDAGKIVKLLQDKKVNYKLKDDGTTILAPMDKIHQLRLELANQGLPKNGDMGFEIFDRTDFQSSEFGENIKYVRALQGELSKTITSLDAIAKARVNLSLPRRRIYLGKDSEPSASVLLDLKQGQTINEEQIKGVAQVVACSVHGMKLENVTIMSTGGRLLSDFIQESGYGLSNQELKICRRIEKETEQKVRSLLDSSLGPGSAVVNAHAEIKTDSRTIRKETYEPVEGNTGIVRSSQSVVENYDEKSEASTKATKKAPKKDSKKDSKKETTSAKASTEEGKTDNKGPVYIQKSDVVNYEISKVIEEMKISPGKLKKLSVGVLVNTSSGITAGQLKDLKAVIASVSGINPQRGDVLTVRAIKFKIIEIPEEEEEKNQIEKYINKFAPYIIPCFSPFLIFIFLLTQLKRNNRGGSKRSKKSAVEDESISLLKAERSPVFEKPGFKKEPVDNSARDNIRELAKDNPKEVARIIEKLASGE
ncbi:MAG: flagellar M-ring protein FliF [Candidatus Eremiobacteraeota bacterium]|nr:flagellar M-ring protein FliF [Candidatus Eremiobacteraeota bacterium]